MSACERVPILGWPGRSCGCTPAGLEWLHRLRSEPLRLFGRYRHMGSVYLWHALRGTPYSRGAAGR